MKKKFKLSFIKSIIKSDFFISTRVRNLSKNSKFESRYKDKMVFMLNIWTLYLELKAMTRMIRFHYTSLTPKGKLIVFLSNELYSELAKNFIKRYKLEKAFSTTADVPLKRENIATRYIRTVLYLSNSYNLDKLSKMLFRQRILLTTLFNLRSQKATTNYSMYSVMNLLDHNKKLLFLLSLLEISSKVKPKIKTKVKPKVKLKAKPKAKVKAKL